MDKLDSGTLTLLVIAVVVLATATLMLWQFVRLSTRDPLTVQAPDARSALARRWAGVYVRRTQREDTLRLH